MGALQCVGTAIAASDTPEALEHAAKLPTTYGPALARSLYWYLNLGIRTGKALHYSARNCDIRPVADQLSIHMPEESASLGACIRWKEATNWNDPSHLPKRHEIHVPHRDIIRNKCTCAVPDHAAVIFIAHMTILVTAF